MVAAASALQVPLFLGERGDQAGAPEDETGPVRERTGPCGLTTLAAELECGRVGVLSQSELGAELQTRLALKTLRRRAEKRGFSPVLRCGSREFQSVARSAGWQTELIRGSQPAGGRCPGTGPLGAVGSDARANSPAPGPLAYVAGLRPAQRGTGPSTPEPPARALASPALVWRWAMGLVPIAVLVATVLFPYASVTVVPISETTVIDVPLTVDPEAKKADAATGTLPGRAITKEISDTLSAPATGRRTVPDTKATGEVVLLNRAETPVSVPKGTVLLAGAVKFATQSDVTVAPSRRAGNAPIFGMVTVKVQAVSGGPSGNVDRNEIDKIEGPLSTSLSVQNNQPTRGGTERAATFVTDDDRKKLQEQLYRTLADRLTLQVKKDMPTSDKESLVAWSGQNPAIVEAGFSKNVDEEAPNVSLTLKLRYGATAFSNDGYNQLVREVAARDAVPAKPGYRVAPHSVQPEPPSLAGAQNGVVRLVGRVRATISTDVDAGKLRADLAGKPVAAARAYLAELPGIQAHDVQAVNFLPGKMPLLGWRIGVSARAAA